MALRTIPSGLEPLTRTAKSFPTNILIVGGSYSGLSALVALKNHLKQRQEPRKVAVTLIEPKAGLLNILGVPRAIVDTEFAKTQYIPLQDLTNLPFDRIVSDDEYVLGDLGSQVAPNNNTHIDICYVQGSVTRLRLHTAEYTLNNNTDNTGTIDFDYVVVAVGRNRSWPTSPLAYNYESYMKEMVGFKTNVEKCKTISVVGAGAVGIEIAGDIKFKYPSKDVILVHPHAKFPPEPLTDAFKDAVRDSLERAEVNVKTGYRVKQELPNKQLEFTDGLILSSDFTYWCTSFRNNTLIFGGELAKYISPKNNIYVNEYLQLTLPDTKELHEHLFCIGDLVELPIIKSAGWALYMGRQVANNLTYSIFEHTLVEQLPDLSQMPRGMVLVAGNGEIVSELTGEVELNNKGYVEEYKDFCIGKIRVTLGA